MHTKLHSTGGGSHWMSMCWGPGSFPRAIWLPDIQTLDTAKSTESGLYHGTAKETQWAQSKHRPIPMPFYKQTARFGIYVFPQLILTLLIPKLIPTLTVNFQVTQPLQSRVFQLQAKFCCFLVWDKTYREILNLAMILKLQASSASSWWHYRSVCLCSQYLSLVLPLCHLTDQQDSPPGLQAYLYHVANFSSRQASMLKTI